MQRIDPKSDSYSALMFDVITNAHRYVPREFDSVLDLGAHFGMFSLYCAARGAEVVAFEPASAAFEELQHSSRVAAEIGMGAIWPMKYGVWNKGEDQLLYLCPETTGSNSIVRTIPIDADITTVSTSKFERIRVVSLSTALSADQMVAGRAIEDIQRKPSAKMWSCVKMDIEGAEYEVLRTTSTHDLRRIKFLTMELHNDILTRDQCKEIDDLLRGVYSLVETLPVKVQGQATDQVSAYYCWR